MSSISESCSFSSSQVLSGKKSLDNSIYYRHIPGQRTLNLHLWGRPKSSRNNVVNRQFGCFLPLECVCSSLLVAATQS